MNDIPGRVGFKIGHDNRGNVAVVFNESIRVFMLPNEEAEVFARAVLEAAQKARLEKSPIIQPPSVM